MELAAYADAEREGGARRRFAGLEAQPVAEGWEDRWRLFHVPVVVAGLWIGPPWEPAPAGLPAVVIDPGRAFGTGAHPTTRLCVELLAGLAGGSLLDVGSGSGVLSIAAARLGFAPLRAVDADGVAVDAARRNTRANGVLVDVEQADALLVPQPTSDVVVANIALEPVEALAPLLQADVFVASGYLEGDRPRAAGFRHRERRTLEGWAADVFDRR